MHRLRGAMKTAHFFLSKLSFLGLQIDYKCIPLLINNIIILNIYIYIFVDNSLITTKEGDSNIKIIGCLYWKYWKVSIS